MRYPPNAVLTKDGQEIYDLLIRSTYGELRQGNTWDLYVTASMIQPDYEPAGLYCQSLRDGYSQGDIGGATDFVGVMVLMTDGEGNLVNTLSPPPDPERGYSSRHPPSQSGAGRL